MPSPGQGDRIFRGSSHLRPGSMGGFRFTCGECSPGSGALGGVKGACQGLCDLFAEGFGN